MNFIDEKGRLFGKINLIDFLVIIFLLSLIPLSFLGYQIYKKRYNSAIKQPSVFFIEMYCKFIKVNPEISKLIAIGDKEADKDGSVIGEIVWLGEEKPYEYEFSIGSEDKITKKDPNLKEIIAKIRLKARIDTASNTLYYKDSLINIGSKFILKTDKYSTEAVMTKELSVKKTVQLNMNCRLIKLSPDTLELIAVGDKEVDEDGNVIGEIVWLGKNKPYDYELNIGDKDKPIKAASDLKEVFAKLRIDVQIENDNNIYYKAKEINTKSSFFFKTGKYNIEARMAFTESPNKTEMPINISVDCRLTKLSPDTLKLIAVGDKEVDEDGNVIGQVIWLGEERPYEYSLNIGDKDKPIKAASDLKEVFAKLKLRAQIGDNNNVYYNNEEVTVNFPIKFKTSKYMIDAIPYTVTLKEKQIQVKVKFSGLIPEVASIIKEGDIEKDIDGVTQAKIEKIISIKPSEILTVKDSNWFNINHPFLKDLKIIFELLCRDKDGILYYKNYPVKMGNVITFSSDLYAISGTIIGVEIQ